MHGELAQTKTQQHARQAHVSRHFTAHRHGNVDAVRAADDVRDQVENRGMQGVVEMGDGVVGAVDRQGVLDQVVGAYGEEIQLARER